MGFGSETADFALQEMPPTVFDRAYIDDHIYFGGSFGECVARFVAFGGAGGIAQGKTNDGSYGDVGLVELLYGAFDIGRGHAYGGKMILACFLAKEVYIMAGAVGA